MIWKCSVPDVAGLALAEALAAASPAPLSAVTEIAVSAVAIVFRMCALPKDCDVPDRDFVNRDATGAPNRRERGKPQGLTVSGDS
jgi:hypothetical protein